MVFAACSIPYESWILSHMPLSRLMLRTLLPDLNHAFLEKAPPNPTQYQH